MNGIQNAMWDVLCELSGEDVARLFTDYHGLQLLDEGFYEFLQEEGIIYVEDEDEEDDDDDDEEDDEEDDDEDE